MKKGVSVVAAIASLVTSIHGLTLFRQLQCEERMTCFIQLKNTLCSELKMTSSFQDKTVFEDVIGDYATSLYYTALYAEEDKAIDNFLYVREDHLRETRTETSLKQMCEMKYAEKEKFRKEFQDHIEEDYCAYYPVFLDPLRKWVDKGSLVAGHNPDESRVMTTRFKDLLRPLYEEASKARPSRIGEDSSIDEKTLTAFNIELKEAIQSFNNEPETPNEVIISESASVCAIAPIRYSTVAQQGYHDTMCSRHMIIQILRTLNTKLAGRPKVKISKVPAYKQVVDDIINKFIKMTVKEG